MPFEVTEIYGGPAQVVLYDSTNGYQYLGWCEDVSLKHKMHYHKTIEKQLSYYADEFMFNADALVSSQNAVDQLRSRLGLKQTIYIIGFKDFLTISNMEIVFNAQRLWKDGNFHTIKINGGGNNKDDIVHRHNILGNEGAFETPVDGSVGTGWVLGADTTGSLVVSFRSGQAQQINIGTDSNSGISNTKILPVLPGTKITISTWIRTLNIAGGEKIRLAIAFLDADNNWITQKAATIDVNFEDGRRISFSAVTEDWGKDIARVRFRLQKSTENITIEMDDAQMELGGLTDQRNY